jgi:hypothetical protein
MRWVSVSNSTRMGTSDVGLRDWASKASCGLDITMSRAAAGSSTFVMLTDTRGL